MKGVGTKTVPARPIISRVSLLSHGSTLMRRGSDPRCCANSATQRSRSCIGDQHRRFREREKIIYLNTLFQEDGIQLADMRTRESGVLLYKILR